MNEIYHVRLNTGEDLISELSWPETKPGHESHIVLHNPMKIIAVPSPKAGFVQLSLMQWIFNKITSDQQFNVFSRDILTMSKPNQSLIEYYKETVDYFNMKNIVKEEYEEPPTDIEEYIQTLEKELDALEESDKIVQEGKGKEVEKIVSQFLSSLTSNNRGTLH